MKVLECCAYATGGVRTHLCDLVVEIESAGHEVLVAVPKVVGRHYLQNRDLENGNATLYPLDNMLGLYKQIKHCSKDVDLIHAHGIRAGGMAVLARSRQKNKQRTPVVITLHNTAVNARPGLVGWVKTKCAQFLAWLCAKADLVLAVSQDVADMMHKYQAKRVEIAIVPGPRDCAIVHLTESEKSQLLRELANLSGVEDDAANPINFVLTVARLAPQKGIKLLLEVSENFKIATKNSDESASNCAVESIDNAAVEPVTKSAIEPAVDAVTEPAVDATTELAANTVAGQTDTPRDEQVADQPNECLAECADERAAEYAGEHTDERAAECADEHTDEHTDGAPIPRLHFLVAGEGPLRVHLEKEIETRRLPVTLLGHRKDLMNLLQVAQVGLSTAVWEGQPIWLREALSCALPLVVTDVGGCRQVVGDAAIITAQDSAEITQALRQLMTHPDQLADLKAKADTASQQAPTYGQVVEQVLSVMA